MSTLAARQRANANYRARNRARTTTVLPAMLACCKCKVVKPVSSFAKDRGGKRGFRHDCRECQNAADSLHYKANRQAYLAYQKRYRQLYPAKVLEAQRLANMKRRKADPVYRLTVCLRGRLGCALRGLVKSAATMKLIGCTVDFLVEHLTAHFQPGMTWANYGSYWVVDHKIPCAKFDLADPAEQLRCFNWSNLQPLTKEANRLKGASV